MSSGFSKQTKKVTTSQLTRSREFVSKDGSMQNYAMTDIHFCYNEYVLWQRAGLEES